METLARKLTLEMSIVAKCCYILYNVCDFLQSIGSATIAEEKSSTRAHIQRAT